MKGAAAMTIAGCIITIAYMLAAKDDTAAARPSIMTVNAPASSAGKLAVDEQGSEPLSVDDMRNTDIPKKSVDKLDDFQKADASSILDHSSSLKLLHDKIAAEGRDERWAHASEEQLAGFFRDIPDAGDLKNKITVRCGTTLCEVTGELQDGDHGYDGRLDAGMSDTEFTAQMWRNGYRDMGSGRGPGRDGRPTFVGYYQRVVPIEIRPQKRVPDGDP